MTCSAYGGSCISSHVQTARCASEDEEEEDEIMAEEAAAHAGPGSGNEGEASWSKDDEPVSDIEGSDPEDETEAQSAAVAAGLTNMDRDETRKKYRGGGQHLPGDFTGCLQQIQLRITGPSVVLCFAAFNLGTLLIGDSFRRARECDSHEPHLHFSDSRCA